MFFFINFKVYDESTGKNALSLIRRIEEKFGNSRSIAVVLNPMDSMIETKMAKFIQTAEPLEPGAYTGHIPIGILPKYGFSGVMINHSENRVSIETIGKSVLMASGYKLKTLVCAEDVPTIERVAAFGPDYIAYEPPELIGGDVSVSSARREIVAEAAKILQGKRSALVVGAGIKSKQDIRMSKELGAQGVLVASGVVKSKEPIRVVEEMMSEVE